MTGTGLSRSKSTFLTLFLVGTLLLCHGIFGALHLCSTVPVPVHHDHHEHPSSVEEGMGAHEHLVCHAMTDYFAVLFTALLGLVLGLLLKGARSRATVATPIIAGRRYAPVVLHPPRGPTLPVLQVFRL